MSRPKEDENLRDLTEEEVEQLSDERPCSRCTHRTAYQHHGRTYYACDTWECSPDIDEEGICYDQEYT